MELTKVHLENFREESLGKFPEELPEEFPVDPLVNFAQKLKKIPKISLRGLLKKSCVITSGGVTHHTLYGTTAKKRELLIKNPKEFLKAYQGALASWWNFCRNSLWNAAPTRISESIICKNIGKKSWYHVVSLIETLLKT